MQLENKSQVKATISSKQQKPRAATLRQRPLKVRRWLSETIHKATSQLADPTLATCFQLTGFQLSSICFLKNFFFVSCTLVSLSLSVTSERDEKLRDDKEVAVQPN